MIHMTGYKRDAIEEEWFFNQNSILLSKPITLERLEVALRSALDR
jgi:hypothetical protein